LTLRFIDTGVDVAVFNWRAWLKPKTRKSSSQRERRARLGLEELEGRSLPSAGLSTSQQFVSQVYIDLMQRPADPTGLAMFSAQINAGTSEATVVGELEASQEYREDEVVGLYLKLLGRDPDPSGLNLWTYYLTGNSLAATAAEIASSPEYFQDAGNTQASVLNRLSIDFLDQPISAASEAYYAQELDTGSTTGQVIEQMETTTAYYQLEVEGIYTRFLHRTADTGGLDTYVAALAGGATPQQVIATILTSSEYSTRTPGAPEVISPAAPVATNASSYVITGMAETGSLIKVYDDPSNSAVLTSGDALVGEAQLAPTLMAPPEVGFAVRVPLTAGAANHFLVTATNSFDHQSLAAVVPTIMTSTSTVTRITPAAGPTAGDAAVVITGTNLTGVSAVMFGNTPATAFTVNSPTEITATAPPGTVGVVNVTVKTADGDSVITAADRYTFEAAPTVTGIAPDTGLTTGGTAVIISGSNFTGASAVMFGAIPAKTFIVNSLTKITAIAPAETAGLVDVTVKTPGGTATTPASDGFTYAALPAVSAIAPAAGPTKGGTTVMITGANFTGATAVMFGAIPVKTFTVNSPTQITAIAPADMAGPVNVTVKTARGSSAATASDRFTYEAAPVVSGIAPGAGGTVMITGANFTGATDVMFGNTPAETFTVASPTRITATPPVGIVTTVNIAVTTPGGTSATSDADEFTSTTELQMK
jgi:hypothetical protein